MSKHTESKKKLFELLGENPDLFEIRTNPVKLTDKEISPNTSVEITRLSDNETTVVNYHRLDLSVVFAKKNEYTESFKTLSDEDICSIIGIVNEAISIDKQDGYITITALDESLLYIGSTQIYYDIDKKEHEYDYFHYKPLDYRGEINISTIPGYSFSESQNRDLVLPSGFFKADNKRAEDGYLSLIPNKASLFKYYIENADDFYVYYMGFSSDIKTIENGPYDKPIMFEKGLSGTKGEGSILALPSLCEIIRDGAFNEISIRVIIVPKSLQTIEANTFKRTRETLQRVYYSNKDDLDRVKALFNGFSQIKDYIAIGI